MCSDRSYCWFQLTQHVHKSVPWRCRLSQPENEEYTITGSERSGLCSLLSGDRSTVAASAADLVSQGNSPLLQLWVPPLVFSALRLQMLGGIDKTNNGFCHSTTLIHGQNTSSLVLSNCAQQSLSLGWRLTASKFSWQLYSKFKQLNPSWLCEN